MYKRLPDVLPAQGETIRVKHTLRPLGVAMAGRDVYDPYKGLRGCASGPQLSARTLPPAAGRPGRSSSLRGFAALDGYGRLFSGAGCARDEKKPAVEYGKYI